jgi:hypothetical protein
MDKVTLKSILKGRDLEEAAQFLIPADIVDSWTDEEDGTGIAEFCVAIGVDDDDDYDEVLPFAVHVSWGGEHISAVLIDGFSQIAYYFFPICLNTTGKDLMAWLNEIAEDIREKVESYVAEAEKEYIRG